MGRVFNELLESVQQMDDIYRGNHEPSRRFVVDDAPLRQCDADSSDNVFDISSTPPKARNEKAL